MESKNLDDIRLRTLQSVDASKKVAVRFLVAAGVFETVVMVAVLVLIDFSNKTHLLIFLTGCLVYGTLAFGLLALKAHIDSAILRVLQAVELSMGEEDAPA